MLRGLEIPSLKMYLTPPVGKRSQKRDLKCPTATQASALTATHTVQGLGRGLKLPPPASRGTSTQPRHAGRSHTLPAPAKPGDEAGARSISSHPVVSDSGTRTSFRKWLPGAEEEGASSGVASEGVSDARGGVNQGAWLRKRPAP